MSAAFEILCTTEDEQAWLEARNGGIGASEIALVLGASSWSSILTLYAKKTGEEVPEDEQTEHQQWGKLLEPAIRDELARRAEVTLLEAPPRLIRSTEHRWAIATPDALTTSGEPVEVKNLSFGYDEEDWAVGIPEQYYLQCQHQMLVADAKRCLFGALLWGYRMVWEWVERDEVAIRRIIRAGAEFWRRVEERDEPPSDGHPDARRLLGMRADNENTIELYESEIGDKLRAYELAQARLDKANAEQRAAKKACDASKDHLAQAMGNHRTAVTSTGWSLKWKTTERRGYTVAATSFETFKIEPPKEK